MRAIPPPQYLITFGHFIWSLLVTYLPERMFINPCDHSSWSLLPCSHSATLSRSDLELWLALISLDHLSHGISFVFLCETLASKKAEMCCSSPTLLVISLRRIKCNLRNKNVHDKPCAHLLEGICLNKVNSTILPERRHQLRISDKERNFFHYGSFCQSYQLFLSIWVASRTHNLPKEK